jgi:DivIVA domain-containing protein
VATADPDPAPMHPADIAEHSFTTARKGYTPDDVHEFLKLVAERVAQLEGEVDWERARVEHQQRRSAAAQESAYARVARDFMDVVKVADEAAQRVLAEAEAEAMKTIAAAHDEADQIVAGARAEAQGILAGTDRRAGVMWIPEVRAIEDAP